MGSRVLGPVGAGGGERAETETHAGRDRARSRPGEKTGVWGAGRWRSWRLACLSRVRWEAGALTPSEADGSEGSRRGT